MRYALLYLLSIVAVNVAFDVVPLVTLPGGDLWSPVALVVGFIFVIRDYAQREIGHYVLVPMLIGAVLSGLLTRPELAVASVTAFIVGEMFDWAVYSFTGRPFHQRVLLSSAISTPIDSTVFLSLLGILSLPSMLCMTASKMLGALLIVYITAPKTQTAKYK